MRPVFMKNNYSEKIEDYPNNHLAKSIVDRPIRNHSIDNSSIKRNNIMPTYNLNVSAQRTVSFMDNHN